MFQAFKLILGLEVVVTATVIAGLLASALFFSFTFLWLWHIILRYDIQIPVENPFGVKDGWWKILKGCKFQIHDGMVAAWKKLFTLGLESENYVIWYTLSEAGAWVVSRKSVFTAREPTVLSVMESEINFLFSRKHYIITS